MRRREGLQHVLTTYVQNYLIFQSESRCPNTDILTFAHPTICIRPCQVKDVHMFSMFILTEIGVKLLNYLINEKSVNYWWGNTLENHTPYWMAYTTINKLSVVRILYQTLQSDLWLTLHRFTAWSSTSCNRGLKYNSISKCIIGCDSYFVVFLWFLWFQICYKWHIYLEFNYMY